jgi:hypothetical protein
LKGNEVFLIPLFRPYYEDLELDPIAESDPVFQDYSYIWNGIWLVVVTMTSVGFGDYYPRSHLGRFIIIITTFWGVFLISMCIVSVGNYRKFYSTERYVRIGIIIIFL